MDVFMALGDPVRRALLRRLAEGPARVVDLAADHDISRPAVSRHLKVLGDAGLVAGLTQGRERHYRLVPAALEPVAALLGELNARTPRVPEHVLDGLDLEVRRTTRDRTAERQARSARTERKDAG
ncbi:ArsR/SmtB family transcription factor [Kocuria rhizosphaericola]|uniref:ArsR/SmtB family transcription factor n=1 Tax=Kocuria rhizosphaericola TaxID=3376284 RepID=UPI0037936BEF